MQPKILIAIVLLVIGGLAVFNIMNTSRVNASINAPISRDDETQDTATSKTVAQSTETKVSDKPLSQQPKAMIDKATGDIKKAQKLEQDKKGEIDSLQ